MKPTEELFKKFNTLMSAGQNISTVTKLCFCSCMQYLRLVLKRNNLATIFNGNGNENRNKINTSQFVH